MTFRERPLNLIVRLLVEKDGRLYECQPVPQGYKCGKCLPGQILGGWQPKCRVCGAKVQPNAKLTGRDGQDERTEARHPASPTGSGLSDQLGHDAWSGPHIWTAQQATWFHDQGCARQEVYRHKKTGGIYGVVCNATRESDGELLVVYRNVATGERWVRPASEFNDGRFERVA